MRAGWLLRKGQKRGDKVGVTRAGKASKRHVVVDGNGLPLGVCVESGQVADVKAAPLALASIRVPRRQGRPRSRPEGLAADRGYDSRSFRQSLAKRGIRHSIPLKRIPSWHRRRYRPQVHPELSGNRWVVERFFAWLNGFRRLSQRFDYYSSMYEAFLLLACSWICLRRLLQ